MMFGSKSWSFFVDEGPDTTYVFAAMLAFTVGLGVVDHRILLEDVHLLDAGDLLHAQTLDGVIQTLVAVRRGLVHGFVLTARLKRTQRNANRRSVARS